MNIDSAFGIHAQALILRSQRAELLAANMANADTPNFKARDFDFHSVLNQSKQQFSSLATTDSRHLNIGNSQLNNARFQYRNPSQPSLDGNTVDEDIERSEFMQNAVMYQASLRFLNGKISGLLTAIRGE